MLAPRGHLEGAISWGYYLMALSIAKLPREVSDDKLLNMGGTAGIQEYVMYRL